MLMAHRGIFRCAAEFGHYQRHSGHRVSRTNQGSRKIGPKEYFGPPVDPHTFNQSARPPIWISFLLPPVVQSLIPYFLLTRCLKSLERLVALLPVVQFLHPPPFGRH